MKIKRPKPGTWVVLVLHHIESEGQSDVRVFGGKDARAKAWGYVASLLQDYVDERNAMNGPETQDVVSALEKNDTKAALDAWTEAQDVGSVRLSDKEDIRVDEQEVE